MKRDFEKAFLSFGSQLTEKGLTSGNLEMLSKKTRIDGIIVVGMGGSGLPGNILQGLQKIIKLPVPIIVSKNFGVPETSLKHPLFVFISFSGNTEETLSGIYALLKLPASKRPPIAVITSGGKLKSLAEQKKLPRMTFFVEGLTPRQSLGYMYYSLTKLLHTLFPSVHAHNLSSTVRASKHVSEARSLIKHIRNRIALIYTTPRLAYLGYVWKINLNETGKHPAFTNTFPELAHNEIVSFDDTHFRYTAIVIEDKKASEKLKKTIQITKNILSEKGVRVVTVRPEGNNEEEQSWNMVALAQLTALFLAEAKGVDPIKTQSIDTLKKQLKTSK